MPLPLKPHSCGHPYIPCSSPWMPLNSLWKPSAIHAKRPSNHHGFLWKSLMPSSLLLRATLQAHPATSMKIFLHSFEITSFFPWCLWILSESSSYSPESLLVSVNTFDLLKLPFGLKPSFLCLNPPETAHGLFLKCPETRSHRFIALSNLPKCFLLNTSCPHRSLPAPTCSFVRLSHHTEWTHAKTTDEHFEPYSRASTQRWQRMSELKKD